MRAPPTHTSLRLYAKFLAFTAGEGDGGDSGDDDEPPGPASRAACLRLRRTVAALANHQMERSFVRSNDTEAGVEDEARAMEARRARLEAAAGELAEMGGTLVDTFVAEVGQLASASQAYGASPDWVEVEVHVRWTGGTGAGSRRRRDASATVCAQETKLNKTGTMLEVEVGQDGRPELRLERKHQLQAWLHVHCVQALVARCNERLAGGGSVLDLEELPLEVRQRLGRHGVTRLVAADTCRYRVHNPG